MANLMAKKIAARLAAPFMLSPSYTAFDEKQGQRDYKITEKILEQNFRGNTVTAVGNKLVTHNLDSKRDQTFFQLAMPWNSQFMHTPTDKQRLNNPSQESFVTQPQMTVPNVYGQFYAFMKALSAAFGSLQN